MQQVRQFQDVDEEFAAPQSRRVALTDSQARLKTIIRGIDNLANIDIPDGIIIDIITRMLFNEGKVSIRRMADVIKVHPALLDQMMQDMQLEHLVEVARANQLGRLSYIYALTDAGTQRARDAMERSLYIGPAPVPLDKYNEAILLQTEHKATITPQQLKASLSHLILPENFDRSIGPAINQGSSVFLYGLPGNGKTTIAEAVGELVSGTDPIWFPYAVEASGAIIALFDTLIHKEVEVTKEIQNMYGDYDHRWGLFKRPNVMVGGELTLESLDLRYDESAKFYEAPLQMKANGGMFLVDDFGRQMITPAELLNRWIVPLESEFDFLKLRSGQTLRVPFKQLIFFSTNLDPNDLVDGAFLRRIQMKVEVKSPNERMFYQLFVIMCKSIGFEFDKATFRYLLQEWYQKPGRMLQAVHPRDLLKVARALCEYSGDPMKLSPKLIHEACEAYFV